MPRRGARSNCRRLRLGRDGFHVVDWNDDEPSATEILHAHCHAAPPDPRMFVPGVPDGCATIVERAMAKNPEDRYQTVDALVASLQTQARGKIVVHRTIGDQVFQVSTFDVLDNEVRPTSVFTVVPKAHDVRAVEPSQQPGLLEKAFSQAAV
jgi:serine/threonine protein kinase